MTVIFFYLGRSIVYYKTLVVLKVRVFPVELH